MAPAIVRMFRSVAGCMIGLTALVQPALAGPPYQSDDPQPTDYRHFEIYTFSKGAFANSGSSGATGIDYNYGAAPNLQLTAVLPAGFDAPADGAATFGLSNHYHLLGYMARGLQNVSQTGTLSWYAAVLFTF